LNDLFDDLIRFSPATTLGWFLVDESAPDIHAKSIHSQRSQYVSSEEQGLVFLAVLYRESQLEIFFAVTLL
jgi:hypothetical protein